MDVQVLPALEEGMYRSQTPSTRSLKTAKSTLNLVDSHSQIVKRTSVDLSAKIKLSKDGIFRKTTPDVLVELRGRVLVLSTGEVLDLDDATIERGRKKEDIKIREMTSDHGFKMVFESAIVADKWFGKMTASSTEKISLSDFKVITPIGKGGMGSVFLVQHKETLETCAMKVLRRYAVEETDKSMRRALDERMVLEIVAGHPFIIQLKYAFQTKKNLYMVTDFCPGGDLHDYLQARKFQLEESVVKQFFTEIVLSIEYLHKIGAVYRDLKPENILLDNLGHIKLADLGLAKILEAGPNGRTTSFCGTKKFMAPEVYYRKGHGTTADMWSLGVLLYALLTGTTPYSDPASFVLDEFHFPKFLSEDAVDMLKGLLRPEKDRMNIEDVKSHKWFENVVWDEVYLNATTPRENVWEEWEQKMLDEGMYLHSKAERIQDLSIGDDEKTLTIPKKPSRMRLVKRGSKVNLIPGYMFSPSLSSRSSFSAASVVSN